MICKFNKQLIIL